MNNDYNFIIGNIKKLYFRFQQGRQGLFILAFDNTQNLLVFTLQYFMSQINIVYFQIDSNQITQNPSMDSNINPIELFKQEMDSDDISSKVNNIHKIPIVIALITPENIKNNLLPYLETLIKKEDDEVVFAIAEELTNVGPALGNQHTIVLQILQNLCAHDETVIRDRAVKSVSKLIEKYTDNQIHNFIIPMIIRLASNQNNFTCRVSATHLICNVYARAGQNKQKLRQKFSDISNEEMLLLQRVTATKIPLMCKVYEKQFILQDLISILKNRSTDEQDQIRVLATDSFKEVAKFLTRDENKTYIMPLIIQAAEDKSWRVRLCLSKNFPEIARSFGKQIADVSLIQTYSNLLKDAEIDVKIQAVKSLGSFVQIVSSDKIGVLVSQVIALGKDSLTVVRANASSVIKSMIASVSKDQAYQNIQPLIKDLMKDQNQQVRKGGIDAAAKFVEVLGPQTISALQASFKSSSEDNKWRVRLQLMDNICRLSVNLKNYDFFLKHMEPLYMNFLSDRASGVRNTGIKAVANFAKTFGQTWLNSFIPKLEQILNKQASYHFKIAAIYSLKEIALSHLGEKYVEKCLGNIYKMTTSQVPNIREVSIKALRDIFVKYDKGTIRESIKKQIVALTNDTDFEVKMTANEVLSKL